MHHVEFPPTWKLEHRDTHHSAYPAYLRKSTLVDCLAGQLTHVDARTPRHLPRSLPGLLRKSTLVDCLAGQLNTLRNPKHTRQRPNTNQTQTTPRDYCTPDQGPFRRRCLTRQQKITSRRRGSERGRGVAEPELATVCPPLRMLCRTTRAARYPRDVSIYVYIDIYHMRNGTMFRCGCGLLTICPSQPHGQKHFEHRLAPAGGASKSVCLTGMRFPHTRRPSVRTWQYFVTLF
jgi:hypothetical protein